MAPVPPLTATRAAAPTPEIRDAIAQASRRSGVSFDYLVRQAAAESGFDAGARAKTSSATGLYQFIESTWLDTVRLHGPKHGLGDFADAIRVEPRRGAKPGESPVSPRVADPELRRRILDLRNDPTIAAVMAGEYARANQDQLRAALGTEPGATELYLAHFLGPAGATRFLRARAADGAVDAAAIAPEAAEANRGVFFAPDGRARSLDEVHRSFAAKFDGATAAIAAAPSATTRAAADPFVATATRELVLRALSGQSLSPVAVAVLAALDDESAGTGLAATFASRREGPRPD